VSNEVRELKEHVRLLESCLRQLNVGSLEANVESIIDAVDNHAMALKELGDVANNNVENLGKLIAAVNQQNHVLNKMIEILNRQVTQPPLPFNGAFELRTHKPKPKTKFKPKIVKDDERPEPDGAA
jgi:hypothetical protein